MCLRGPSQIIADTNGGETGLLRERPFRIPICPPQISRGLTQDCCWVSAVRGYGWTNQSKVCSACTTQRKSRISNRKTNQLVSQSAIWLFILSYGMRKYTMWTKCIIFNFNPAGKQPQCCNVFEVWCTVSATRIIELGFFSGAVNLEITVNKVLYHILKMRKNRGFFSKAM